MLQHKTDFSPEMLADKLWHLSEAAFPYGSPWSVEQFLGDLGNQRSHYFLEIVEGELVGYLVLHQLFEEAEVINVAVMPDFKGKKIAASLFQAAFEELGQHGLATVFLEVRETNTPALKLYERLGFQEISRRKKYYHHPTEDGLVMQYQLKETGEVK